MPTSALHRLRASVRNRPAVDPGLAGGLRAWLEDGVADATNGLPDGGPPILVTRWSLGRALGCGIDAIGGDGPVGGPDGGISLPVALSVVVHALFRQVVTGEPTRHGLGDGLEALTARDPGDRVVAFIQQLPSSDRRVLEDRVTAHLRQVVADWPRLPATWLPRTGSRVSVPLAGGRVLLTGLLDLTFGRPSAGLASACVVSVRTGAPSPDHQDDLHFLHLLETVRSGAAPLRTATYYSATGDLRVADVDADQLTAAVERTIEGARRLCGAGGRIGVLR